MARRLRIGLQGKLIVASVVLVLIPLVAVWSAGLVEDLIQAQVAREIDERAEALAEEAASRGLDPGALDGEDEAWLRGLGAQHHVMIKVLDADRREVRFCTSAADAERWIAVRRLWMGLDDLFFGPPGPPDLAAFEETLPSEAERPEVRAALDEGRLEGRWRYDQRARMMVYSVAAPIAGGRGAVSVTRVSRRVIRSLYDVRYQLLKLTLFVAAAAILFGLYVGRRMVSPLVKVQRRIDGYLRSPSEEALAGLSLRRRDEIGDLSRAFAQLAGRLRRQAEEAKSLAGDLTHDLKNPIATVTATAELLQDGEGELTEERRGRIARALTEAAAHMNRSVDGLLGLARLDASLAEAERAPVDLVALLEGVIEGYQGNPRCEEKAVRLDLPRGLVGRGPLLVEGIAEQLGGMVKNLVDNGLVFCDREVLITLGVAGESGAAEVTVSDDGPGVSEGNRDKIFRRFFTARPAGAPGGSGLGLTMVAAVARSHGGSLELLEEPPTGHLHGACFRVTLPTA